MNRRVSAHRAGYREPRRYPVEVRGPRADRLRAAALDGHECFGMIVLPIETRPEDWAAAARAILIGRGAWRRSA